MTMLAGHRMVPMGPTPRDGGCVPAINDPNLVSLLLLHRERLLFLHRRVQVPFHQIQHHLVCYCLLDHKGWLEPFTHADPNANYQPSSSYCHVCPTLV